MRIRFLHKVARFASPALLAGGLLAQVPVPAPPPAPAPDPASQTDEATPHKGQIIIQSHGEPPSPAATSAQNSAAQTDAKVPAEDAKADVSDTEREALTITGYDLDTRLNLERSGLSTRARLTVRNDGQAPLRQIALQVSSSLRWESATLLDGDRRLPLTLAQHHVDTDADHTGAATEAVLALPEPLAPGASVSLDLFYTGTVAQDSGRLARVGASSSQGRQADWDGVSPGWTGLRGFGDVLWYPVSSPQLFLSEGNTLFTAIGRMRAREQAAVVRLRLSVEYMGEPPVAAYFSGRRADLKATADDPSAPTATGSGIATAEFAPEPLGFRLPSLFLIGQPEVLLGGGAVPDAAGEPAPGGSSSSNPEAAPAAPAGAQPKIMPNAGTSEPILALVSADPGTAAGLGAAADHAGSLIAEWLGPRPLSVVTLLDHPGQPFQDGPFLVAPAATLETSPEAPALVYSLTHGWVQTGQPWIDEGLAQFFTLLWIERETGRGAALNQLGELMQPVSLAEPEFTSPTDTKPGQPLISATDELFYRRKAAAVWWMLRDLAGEKALRSTLAAWRTQPVSQSSAEAQAIAFQHLLERQSGKDLGWFFNDWVLRDRGLPDLSIANLETSQTPAGPGHNTGYLVAVTVRNEGAATAEVPLIVRSGQFSATQRVRVPGFGQTTQRVLVESAPTEVQVNDGGVPELRSVIHTRQLVPGPQNK